MKEAKAYFLEEEEGKNRIVAICSRFFRQISSVHYTVGHTALL